MVEKLADAQNEQLDAMLLALWQARPAGKPGLSRDTDLRPNWQEALRERGLRSEWKAVLARFNRPEHRYMHNLPGRRPKAFRSDVGWREPQHQP